MHAIETVTRCHERRTKTRLSACTVHASNKVLQSMQMPAYEFSSSLCVLQLADEADEGSTIFQQFTFVGVLFMCSAQPISPFTIDETKKELLFASKSAYFEIYVRIQEI